MVWKNYKCPYLDDMRLRVQLCKIMEQQLWHLLRQTNTPSHQRERISRMVLERRKLWSCVLTEPGTENNFAGETQQQSTGLYWTNDLHGLDTQGLGVQVPVGAWFFSFPRHPDLSRGPPSLLSNCTGSIPIGAQGRGHEADHSSPSSAEVKNCGAIPPIPHVFMA
jgi:hypothetical protein